MTVDEQNPKVNRQSRSLETSARNLVIELIRAISSPLLAFGGTYALAAALHWHQSVGGFAASAAVFVVLGVTALFVTSGRPIQAALAQQRAEISTHAHACASAARTCPRSACRSRFWAHRWASCI
jgi:hypothetical protein